MIAPGGTSRRLGNVGLTNSGTVGKEDHIELATLGVIRLQSHCVARRGRQIRKPASAHKFGERPGRTCDRCRVRHELGDNGDQLRPVAKQEYDSCD
jgi:hypothetical protein